MNVLRNRICIGTATFIQNYGIANTKPDNSLIENIIKRGFNNIDTSPLYGNSINSISSVLKNNDKDLKIISKTNFKDINKIYEKEGHLSVLEYIDKELGGINKSFVKSLLWHSISLDEILDKKIDHLSDSLLNSGITFDLGCSTYGSETAVESYHKNWCSTVQIEFSILNQKCLIDLKPFIESNKKIHLRSILCKGLLTNNWILHKNKLPIKVKNKIKKIDSLAKLYNCNIIDLSIYFALKQKNIDLILIGISSVQELDYLCASLDKIKLIPDSIYNELEDCDCSSYDCTHPERW